MGCKAFVVTFVAKGRHAYKGYIRVQYAQPEVPGGIAQQFVLASEDVTVEESPQFRCEEPCACAIALLARVLYYVHFAHTGHVRHKMGGRTCYIWALYYPTSPMLRQMLY